MACVTTPLVVLDEWRRRIPDDPVPPLGGGAVRATQPSRIGRYEIEAELGRGAMGVVYKARDPLCAQTVALKILSPSLPLAQADWPAFEQRFFREGAIAARLRHPGIVALRDQGRDDGLNLLFLAFEYLEGRTLEAVAATMPLSPEAALQVASRLADAMDYAHARGVIHRDLKPSNVMVLESGKPKIMDFGVGRLLRSEANLTMNGDFLGTPLYMSPEQIMGGVVDGRADLFALGAILYELLTGRKAFAAASLPKVVARILHGELEPPSLLVSGLPRTVDRVVLRALAKSPDDRHRSCADLAADVRAALADLRRPARPTVVAVRGEGNGRPLLSESDLAQLARLLDRLPGNGTGQR